MKTTLFEESTSETVCRGLSAAGRCLRAGNTGYIHPKWNTDLLPKDKRRGWAEMKDSWFPLILTKDVMKLFFISILDAKALVTDYSFLPLHLSLSPFISISLLSPLSHKFTGMSHYYTWCLHKITPLCQSWRGLQWFVHCFLLSHVPFSLATSNRFLCSWASHYRINPTFRKSSEQNHYNLVRATEDLNTTTQTSLFIWINLI